MTKLPFYKDFRRCWYKGRPPCEPRMSCQTGLWGCSTFWSFPSPDHTESYRMLRQTSFARIFFWTPCWELITFACRAEPLLKSRSLEEMNFTHIFLHNYSTLIQWLDTLCINIFEDCMIGFDHGFRIWQFDKSCWSDLSYLQQGTSRQLHHSVVSKDFKHRRVEERLAEMPQGVSSWRTLAGFVNVQKEPSEVQLFGVKQLGTVDGASPRDLNFHDLHAERKELIWICAVCSIRWKVWLQTRCHAWWDISFAGKKW